MCKYCENISESWQIEGQEYDVPPLEYLVKSGIELIIKDGFIYAYCQCGTNVVTEIDFCPKCGTPLGEVKPLTVEQLRQMDGDKISIHYIGRLKGFYRDEIAPYYGQLEQYIQNDNGTLAACELPLKFYGTTWMAFDREPKGEAE